MATSPNVSGSGELPPHSNDPTEELSRVVLALETLMGNTGGQSSTSVNMADRYLISFQRQPIAWVVCDKILATPQFLRSNVTAAASSSSLDLTPHCHFFAAQTLHSKCRNCYAVKGQLPPDSLVSLRDSLLQHLFVRHAAGHSGPVHTQLAMAISALAIQMGWKEVIPFLLAQMQQGESSSSPGDTAHREAKIRMVCDILRFLPEECNSDRLLLERDEEERHWFHNHVFLSFDYEDHMDTPKANNNGMGLRRDIDDQDSENNISDTRPSVRPPPRQAKNAQHVFEFLWFLIQGYYFSSQPQVKIVDKVLQCLNSWIYHVRLPAELLQQSPLVPWVVSLLRQSDGDGVQSISRTSHSMIDSDRMELAVDVLVEILRCYPSDSYWNKGLVQTLYPLILSLGVVLPTQNALNPSTGTAPTPFEMALKRQVEDELRAFTRIFTEMGESYMSLVVGPEDCQQVALVELLLTCSSIPDSDISCITLNFWYRFVASLEEIEPYEYRQVQIDHFTPQLIKLVTTCTALIRYPDDIDSIPYDKLDEIHKDRAYMIETLEDCCRLLGQDLVLQCLGTRLRQECERVSALPSQSQLLQWHSMEASLFSLQSTARYTVVDEKTVLPFVFSLVPQLPASVFHLRNTACLIVGKYSTWLGRNPEYLQPMLPYLAQGLSIPKCASSSANAIKILCEHCSLTLSLGDSVLDLYDGIVAAQQQSHPVLDLQDELLVLEGACKAISLQMSDTTKAKDPERISMYIRRLVEPIGTRLANTTFVGPGSTSPRLALNELERLTVVARFLHLPRPNDDLSSDANRRISSRSEFLTQLMSQCWPWLDTLSQKYPNDFNMAEKVCRLHKHVLRGCGSSGYGDMIQPLCANIVRGYTQSHLSPYLYLASICVSEYGNDSRYVSLLFDMVRDVSEKTFSVLRSPEDLVAQPDVVEELFFLAGRMMTHCPVPLLLSPLLGAMIQFSTVCMKLDHKDANRGTLSFLESTISFGIDLSRGEAHVSNDSQQLISCRESLENCIRSEGIHIVQNLMQALMGTLPCYRLDSPHGSVGGILYKLKQLCPSLTLEWVNIALQPAPDHAKRTLLRSFADTTNNISFDEMMSTVRWFSNYCIREMKMRGE